MTRREFADDVNEASRRLGELLATVRAGQHDLELLSGQLAAETAEAQRCITLLAGDVSTSIAALRQAAEKLQAECSDNSRGEALWTELEDGVTGVEDQMGLLSSSQQEIVQRWSDQGTEWDEVGQETTDQIETAVAGYDTLAGDIEQARTETLSDDATFADQVEQAAGGLTESGGGTVAALQQLSDDLSSDAQERVAGLFAHFHEFFESGVERAVRNGLATTGDSISDSAQEHDDLIETMADQFADRFTDILTQLQGHARERLQAGLSDLVEDLVDDVISSFMEELKESAVVAAAGVTVGGTLSPILPEIVLAKKITGCLNDLLG